MTIIIITGRLEPKNRSAHLADELPKDLPEKKKEKKRDGSQPNGVSALSLTPLLSVESFCSSHPSVTHSVSASL